MIGRVIEYCARHRALVFILTAFVVIGSYVAVTYGAAKHARQQSVTAIQVIRKLDLSIVSSYIACRNARSVPGRTSTYTHLRLDSAPYEIAGEEHTTPPKSRVPSRVRSALDNV